MCLEFGWAVCRFHAQELRLHDPHGLSPTQVRLRARDVGAGRARAERDVVPAQRNRQRGQVVYTRRGSVLCGCATV